MVSRDDISRQTWRGEDPACLSWMIAKVWGAPRYLGPKLIYGTSEVPVEHNKEKE